MAQYGVSRDEMSGGESETEIFDTIEEALLYAGGYVNDSEDYTLRIRKLNGSGQSEDVADFYTAGHRARMIRPPGEHNLHFEKRSMSYDVDSYFILQSDRQTGGILLKDGKTPYNERNHKVENIYIQLFDLEMAMSLCLELQKRNGVECLILDKRGNTMALIR